MPRRVPIAGFRSRTEAIRAFRAQGLSELEIVRLAGLRHKSEIASYLRRASDQKRPRQILLPAAMMADIEIEAEDRGMSGKALALLILHVAIEDELIDAILDDRKAAA